MATGWGCSSQVAPEQDREKKKQQNFPVSQQTLIPGRGSHCMSHFKLYLGRGDMCFVGEIEQDPCMLQPDTVCKRAE